MQLLKNLRQSIATLEICGEWGTGQRANDDASLEVRTERVWMEGRAQQKRLSALQVSDRCDTCVSAKSKNGRESKSKLMKGR